ncbi:unnamed protein product, partial [Vitis vinifera]
MSSCELKGSLQQQSYNLSLTEGHQASTSKVRKLIPTFGALDPRAMFFNKKMGEKINKITRELDAIAKRRLDFHLREGVGGVSFGIEERLPTTSLVDESRIHGRDANKEKIIELMLSDEATQLDKISVISIVGMGGIGKTTLAQIIYKDGRVENRFEKRVWVCVSDDFDVNEMKEKNFFLVLDDVWNEKPPRWDLLQAPFNVAARGSVVLAFKNLNSDACQNLESIGWKIAKKCKGLPLTVKTLAGLLHSKQDSTAWNEVGEAIEEFGSICFDNLLSRSFFQRYHNNDSQFVMHDLIHDLAQFISKKFCFRLEGQQQNQISKEIRHSSCLRVLSLTYSDIKELPHSIENLKHLRYLDLSHTPIGTLPESITTLFNLQTLMLSEMPIEMSRMKNLRTLTTFVVGKHTGSRVGELRDLSHLSGTLAIFKLKNVADARDALESNMKGKECLDKLELNWEDDNAIAGDSHDAASVLEKLQPHSNLKELSIGCYYGAKFSSWLGEPSFINMVRLQPLTVKIPFGSLQTLVFKEISVWEEWDCFGVEGGEFPRLNELRIEYCPKLKGDLPKHLPAPSIQKLNLKECDEVVLRSVVHLPSITELEVSNICSIQVEFPAILLMLTSLRKLVIKECQSLSSLPEMGLPPMLETLRIEKCHILETLPEGMTQNNTSLQSLYIDCDSLTSLPIIYSLKSLEIMHCDSLTSFPLAFFTKLETLNIWGCTNLESLYIPDGVRNMDLTSLQSIYIWDCPNLLKSLPQRMHTLLTSLDDLWILDCPEIVSFPEGDLPTNLSSLEIWNCYKLMESQKEWGLQTLPSLRYLTIRGGT